MKTMKIWTFPIQNIDLIYELLLHFSTNENCIKILRIVKILLLRNLFLENFEFINLYVNEIYIYELQNIMLMKFDRARTSTKIIFIILIAQDR